MKKIFIILTIGLIVVLSAIIKTTNNPTILKSSGLLPALSIDDVIKLSDIIVIGEVKTTHPSQWMDPRGKNPQNASPEEIADARGLFTDSLIFIDNIFKGDIVTANIRVRAFTGQTERVIWKSDTEPDYDIGKSYLLFLVENFGPTANNFPGAYIPVGAYQGVYEIVGDKAISKSDEWLLEDLIAYIQKVLSESAKMPVASTGAPETIATEAVTDTPSEDITPTP